MKRSKVKIVVAVISVFVIMFINIISALSSKESDLLLLNIEAIAQYEGETALAMYMDYNSVTRCYVCEYGGSSGCDVSLQCCKSWGNCPY